MARQAAGKIGIFNLWAALYTNKCTIITVIVVDVVVTQCNCLSGPMTLFKEF
jgi:hypothetical protein